MKINWEIIISVLIILILLFIGCYMINKAYQDDMKIQKLRRNNMAKTLSQMLEDALEVAKGLENVLADYEELISDLDEKINLQQEEIERLSEELEQLKKESN
jgi:peptidoglycan hydrolase CwlO-like protein